MKVLGKPVTEWHVIFSEDERRTMVTALEHFSEYVGTKDMPEARSVELMKALEDAGMMVAWPPKAT